MMAKFPALDWFTVPEKILLQSCILACRDGDEA
jgi:hypothetical protein